MSDGSEAKDVKIRFRSTKEAAGKRGQRVVSYYLAQDAVPALIEALTALQDNEKGVKFMVNMYTNINAQTGNEFVTSEMYVKAVEEFKRTTYKAVPKAQATAAAKASTKEAYKNLNKTVA